MVVGEHSPSVGEHVAARLGADAVAVQSEPLGTGHAVMAFEVLVQDDATHAAWLAGRPIAGGTP